MNDERELRGIIRIVDSLSKTAQEASLTGALGEGKKIAVSQYNAIIDKLVAAGHVSEGLFPKLDEESASFDEVGVVCRQLASYLEGILEPDQPKSSGKSGPGPIFHGDGNVFVSGEMFKELGEWFREQGFIQDILGKVKGKKKEEKENPDEEENISLDEVESRISELGGQMQVLAEKLRRESLSPDEIKKLADEMHKIGMLQADLSRKRARLRKEEQMKDILRGKPEE